LIQYVVIFTIKFNQLVKSEYYCWWL